MAKRRRGGSLESLDFFGMEILYQICKNSDYMKQLKFKNITISGLPGAGSSTLGKGLGKELNWKYFSGGDFMRRYAIEKGLFDKNCQLHHKATVYGDDFDRKVDFGMRESFEKETKKIYDAWLAGFVAQGVKGVLKVLLYCSSDEVRVDRIVNRDKISVEEAKKHIFEREEQNIQKWTRMYAKEWQEWVGKGPVNFYNPKLYDLTIDTYANDRDKTLKLVMEKLS